MLDRYGGAEHLQKPPKELLLGQSESYVEYHPGTGQLVRGTERAKAVSKYVEDRRCFALALAHHSETVEQSALATILLFGVLTGTTAFGVSAAVTVSTFYPR